MSDQEFYYRFDYITEENGSVQILLYRYWVIKRTPKGAWISSHNPNPLYPKFGKKHFVLNDSRKRYAYPDLEKAKESFMLRKKREIEILSWRIDQAKAALELIEKTDPIDVLPCW